MQKIAIHNRLGGFSERWINYCKSHSIPYKIVNAYDNDIVEQVRDCSAFMWHHHHANYKDRLFAKQLLYSLQKKGLKVFPNFDTTWHFDDKVGQKYLLEAVYAPLVPSYVFYTKQDANDWIDHTTFPKVFKLRGGAGADNVKLVRTKAQARKLVHKAFGRGFLQVDGFNVLRYRFNKFKHGRGNFIDVCKGFARLFIPTEFVKMYPREKGYVYFQDFIPQNKFDIRIVVIGDKAFALKRLCRENDFRASGGGRIIYDKGQIDVRCVQIAFEVNEKLNAQSIAYDFVFNSENNPLIVEISYGYAVAAYDNCEGFWTKDLKWHAGDHFDFCGWMVEQVL